MELCEDSYVQKMTFDSYLYKTVVPGNPLDDVKLLVSGWLGLTLVGGAGSCGAGPRLLGAAGHTMLAQRMGAVTAVNVEGLGKSTAERRVKQLKGR